MGWGKLLGDLGKEYLNSRGIEGAIQDANSIKNGISNLFGSSDDDESENDEELMQKYQQLWDETINSVQERIQEQDYNGAFNVLEEHYRDVENGEKDFYYYYWRGVIRLHILDDSDVSKLTENDVQQLYNKITSEVGQANHFCKEEEQKSMLKELKDQAAEVRQVIDAKRQQSEDFNKLVDELIDDETGLKVPDHIVYGSKENDYEQAFKKLDDFYAQYENSYDDVYFIIKVHIYNGMLSYFKQGLKNGKTFDPNMLHEKFAAAKDAAQKMANMNKDDEQLIKLHDRIGEQIDEIEQLLVNVHPADNQKNEEEYLEEIKACLAEDHQISDRERRILNRLRDSLGISESRAQELEDSLTAGGLTKDEKEYVDALKDSMQDGSISDRERRILNRLRESLGITEDRAKELEASLSNK
jgi:hypothetical protein